MFTILYILMSDNSQLNVISSHSSLAGFVHAFCVYLLTKEKLQLVNKRLF